MVDQQLPKERRQLKMIVYKKYGAEKIAFFPTKNTG